MLYEVITDPHLTCSAGDAIGQTVGETSLREYLARAVRLQHPRGGGEKRSVHEHASHKAGGDRPAQDRGEYQAPRRRSASGRESHDAIRNNFV